MHRAARLGKSDAHDPGGAVKAFGFVLDVHDAGLGIRHELRISE
jgi:hypothetical protein